MSDLIDRQAAIEAIDAVFPVDPMKSVHTQGIALGAALAKTYIEQLPSAQFDTYWKEQCQSYEQTINKLRESLSTQPEIVRCKNCKHWIPYDWMFSEVWQSRNIADYSEDEIGCKFCDMTMKANDFCSRAERREVTT